ncbi:lytic transglycosylase domain-containing protein [Lewinella sp. W8]|uniref:lytic transglycosylase domain-containing protein n=1 Tax=Lewinella sp. W8 TaxID=2528208 RepID=UPI001067F173|nr:lytic transglycosylase domain-containing protein [Lewinella sp. W8]MTB51966.1 transglycosylase SLT domain-containing protein [Lewinella sp. W8]
MSKLMKCLLLPVVLLLAVTTTTKANSITETPKSSITQDPETEISRRLAGLQLPLSTSANDAHLQRKLTDYLGNGSHSTERMLGRANQYFPVFEYYLEKHGMPSSLKYLAVAESMLVPGAVSSARAAGLWQLMPATAREMGLRVDAVVDERMDLYRSTEAAVVMLKGLYQQFGDWHLALAAYNCGPGRVRRAIRAAGGHTYYPKVKRFLPQESQQYVAAYVAAAYTINYAGDYGLTAEELLLEDSIATVRVHRALNLRQLSRACDLSYRNVRQLNPSFVRGYIPASSKGYWLRVPVQKGDEVRTYIWGRPNLVMLPADDDLELARQYAGTLNFDVRSWLLGCSSDALHYQPSIVQLEYENQLLLNMYEAYEAVAMN